MRERLGVGKMARTSILDLVFTDHAVSAFDDWNILPDDLFDILEIGDYVVTRNRQGRAASHVLIGYDGRGRCLAAPIAPTHDPTTWRVVTAWPCKPSEASKIR